MPKIKTTLGILLFIKCFTYTFVSNAQNSKALSQIFTCWKTLDYKLSNDYGLEPKQIQDLLKKKVCLSNNTIVVYYDTLYSPKYSIEKFKTKNYLWDNFNVQGKDYNILSDSLYEITIDYKIKSSRDGKFYSSKRVMIYNVDYLFIIQDGVVFRLYKPMKNVQRGSGG